MKKWNSEFLDQMKSLAVDEGLIFLHEEASPDKAERFAVYHDRTCLCASEDLQVVEFYLFGFRDGRTSPTKDSSIALSIIRNAVADIETAQKKMDEAENRVEQARRGICSALQHLAWIDQS